MVVVGAVDNIQRDLRQTYDTQSSNMAHGSARVTTGLHSVMEHAVQLDHAETSHSTFAAATETRKSTSRRNNRLRTARERPRVPGTDDAVCPLEQKPQDLLQKARMYGALVLQSPCSAQPGHDSCLSLQAAECAVLHWPQLSAHFVAMKARFLKHSPMPAQPAHCSSLSRHAASSARTYNGSNAATRVAGALLLKSDGC